MNPPVRIIRSFHFVAIMLAGAPALAQTEEPRVALDGLMARGFEVITTAYIPVTAVERQSDVRGADAIVLTLQKGAQLAVCYYTLNAYVGPELPDIESCRVHRMK